MKRIICLLFVLILVPSISFSDPGVVLCYRMNHYAAAYNDNNPGYFDYDTMMIDVYLMDDFTTAYYVKTLWVDGEIETTGYVKCTVSKGNNHDHILTFPNSETMSFYYDDNGEFWLKMTNGTFHLLECKEFEIKNDLKTE